MYQRVVFCERLFNIKLSAIQGVGGELGSKKGAFTNTLVPSRRSAPDAASEVMEGALKTPIHKPSPRKVTILEMEFSLDCGSDYVNSKPSSTRSSLNSIDFLLVDHLVGPGRHLRD
ncbi:hypothetical protein BGZ83_000845 [Gryganskiella cystojenkinii]|nr:hypothetical protein BGZ83_000845 [Gryganskiella cystojenkinii]